MLTKITGSGNYRFLGGANMALTGPLPSEFGNLVLMSQWFYGE